MLNLNPRCPTRRLLLTSLASAAGLLVLPGCAGAAGAAAGLAKVEVYDRDSGRVLPVHPHDGRRYVPGNPGARYALRLRNLSIGRVLVVLSVDGINVISGVRAAWNQVGYVLEPGRVYDINGWRKSDTEVAAFEFAPIERSYAARTGRPDDVGVIGLAVFRERPLPPPPPVLSAPEVARSERQTAPAARGQAANAAREKSLDDSASSRLGTGHGQREWSLSRRTDFERASSTPDQLTRLEYDSLDRLIAAGVVPAPQGRGWPSPFPANASGYAPDPPRW